MKEMFHVEQFLKKEFPSTDERLFIDSIKVYYENYLTWNQRIKVSTIVKEGDFWIKHILDSLILAKLLQKENLDIKNIIDIGTGGGFPGIVLALVLDKRSILVDKVNKKLRFIQECVQGLDLLKDKLIYKHINFLEGNIYKILGQSSNDSVFVSRAVSLSVLYSFLKKNKNITLFVMTTKKAYDDFNKNNQQLKRNIYINIYPYSTLYRNTKLLSEYFSSYIVVKMFHVEQ